MFRKVYEWMFYLFHVACCRSFYSAMKSSFFVSLVLIIGSQELLFSWQFASAASRVLQLVSRSEDEWRHSRAAESQDCYLFKLNSTIQITCECPYRAAPIPSMQWTGSLSRSGWKISRTGSRLTGFISCRFITVSVNRHFFHPFRFHYQVAWSRPKRVEPHAWRMGKPPRRNNRQINDIQ